MLTRKDDEDTEYTPAGDDWLPTGWESATVIDLRPSGSDLTVTGFSQNNDQKRIEHHLDVVDEDGRRT